MVFQLGFVAIRAGFVTLLGIATDEEDPFSMLEPIDSYVLGGYLFGYGAAETFFLREAGPDIGTTLGMAKNVVVGLGLYYTCPLLVRTLPEPFRGTFFQTLSHGGIRSVTANDLHAHANGSR